MTYIYRLAGNDLELAEAELNGFLESQKVDEEASRNGRIAETDSHPSQLKRLALVHEVSEKVTEASELEELELEEVDGSFAVRKECIADREVEDVESRIGEKMKSDSNEVDLENPGTVFRAYILEESIALGRQVLDIDRGLFRRRSNEKRPFSSPVSMDPVLARVLVNLSGVKPGEHVLDPFCGTGGILIEAGLCGVGVHGRDMNEEMVKGAEENLEAYGIINHDIQRSKISEVDTEGYDALITDLPYGKSSEKTGDAVDNFINLLEGFEGRAVFMYNESGLGGLEADFEVYVHRNLTRYIFIL